MAGGSAVSHMGPVMDAMGRFGKQLQQGDRNLYQ